MMVPRPTGSMGKRIRVNRNWTLEPTGDGQVIARAEGSIAGTIRRNRILQEAAKRDPALTETKGGFMRKIASYPIDVEAEINEKCGQDPDKRNAFLRDHPEFLVVPRSSAKLPPKKTYFFPR